MLAIIIYFIAAQIIEFENNAVSEVCFDIEDSQDKMEIVILDTISFNFYNSDLCVYFVHP